MVIAKLAKNFKVKAEDSKYSHKNLGAALACGHSTEWQTEASNDHPVKQLVGFESRSPQYSLQAKYITVTEKVR